MEEMFGRWNWHLHAQIWQERARQLLKVTSGHVASGQLADSGVQKRGILGLLF